MEEMDLSGELNEGNCKKRKKRWGKKVSGWEREDCKEEERKVEKGHNES